MNEKCLRFLLRSPEETSDLAEQIARDLRPGDVLLLEGPIGAGKTHFARSLIQSLLEFPEDIPSPTFTLVQTYNTKVGELWHADLYRLSDPDEIEELGLLEAFNSCVCLIEWPQKLEDLSPKSALMLSLSLDANDVDHRQCVLTWTEEKWSKRLTELRI